ncbi:hypothetical protein WG66_011779 [Moniliophthora roreri]|nr:hypothetical protein WG66_011779 [Moniliophthora roreri]
MFILVLVFIAFFCLIALLAGHPDFQKDPAGLGFHGDVDSWSKRMEREFIDKRVPEDRKTTFAIEEGLASTVELKGAMQDRYKYYTYFSSQSVWPWTDFVADLSNVNDEAQRLQRGDGSFAAAEVSELVEINNLEIVKQSVIQPRSIHLPDSIQLHGIHLPDIHLPDIHLPSYEDILRRIWPQLKAARDHLERIIDDKTSEVSDVMKSVHDFIAVQISLLPEHVRKAVATFNAYRIQHPYIVAGASIALMIIASELLMPWAMLGVLRIFGFAETGPVAGSWAAAVQSAFYGGRTRGLFSILQSITMSAKRVWPAAVFLDVTAITAGTIVVLPSGRIQEVVEHSSVSFPMFLEASSEQLQRWMIMLGEELKEADVPHVQWMDAAIESFRQALWKADGVDVGNLVL